MPMREECVNFQSRTYDSGEAARFCRLDLAPEAPWRCPDNCPKYRRRMADVGWVHGILVEPAIEEEPAGARATAGGAAGAETRRPVRQRPVNVGGRFSMKAVTASVRSSEASCAAFQV